MLTILYAMICAAIALRLATFNRNRGDYRPLPAMLAWVIAVAAGSVPLCALLGVLLVVDLTLKVHAVDEVAARVRHDDVDADVGARERVREQLEEQRAALRRLMRQQNRIGE